MLGSNMALMARERNKVCAAYLKHPIHIKGCEAVQVDLTRKADVMKNVAGLAPDIIVHTAALTNVDYCEDHHEEARLANATAAENVAEAARKAGSKLVHISTDSVFDGKRGMYAESDTTNPINYYAKTKLMAEKAVSRAMPDALIVRTSIYGWNAQDKASLAEWMIGTLEKGDELRGFSDVFFTPILVNNLSEAVFNACEKNIAGIYHITGSERCSKLDFARVVAGVFGLQKNKIKASTLQEAGLRAPRPKDTSLKIAKAQMELDAKLLNVEDGLIMMKKLRDSGFAAKLKESMVKQNG